MSETTLAFTVHIPASAFKPMVTAPMDGRIIYVTDAFGHVDLAKYDRHGWNAETGDCSEFTGWSEFSIGEVGNE